MVCYPATAKVALRAGKQYCSAKKMPAPDHPDSLLDLALFGLAALSLLVLAYAVGTVRLYIAEGKMRKEESVGAILLSPFPPNQILTAAGRRRAKVGKIALGIFSISVVTLAVRILLSRF